MSTKILAHRGANRKAPQNTLPAFREAIRHGADGVEFDVQMSSDGQLVICHNLTVDATSNGSGYIANKTFEELRALDFGKWFSEAYEGTQIPTLEETLDCVKDMGVLNVEMKHPLRNKVELTHKIVETVKAFGLQDKVVFSSFDFDMMLMVKQIDPSLKCGLLYDPLKTECFDRRMVHNCQWEVMKEYRMDALHPYYSLVNYPPSYVLHAHSLGYMVNIWGISDEKTLEKYKGKGLDMIITDCF